MSSLAGPKVYDNRNSTDLTGITHGDLVVTEHEVLVSRNGRLHFYCSLDELPMVTRLLSAVMVAPAQSGRGLVEYALLLAFTTGVALAVVTLFSGVVAELWAQVLQLVAVLGGL